MAAASSITSSSAWPSLCASDGTTTQRVTVNKLICRYVVGEGGRYEVGVTCMWSVRGRYVVGMWSVSEGDRYVVGREGGVVGKWSVRNCEWSVALRSAEIPFWKHQRGISTTDSIRGANTTGIILLEIRYSQSPWYWGAFCVYNLTSCTLFP